MSSSPEHSGDSEALNGCVDTDGLYLAWTQSPWDTAVYGRPVLQINVIEVRGPSADKDIGAFELARDACGTRLVSCRLSHERLRESMLLEGVGFRFIEMLYQPELGDLQSRDLQHENGLALALAASEDLPAILHIAGTAFRSERFHVDPRLPARLGDQRYQNWVRSSFSHPSQRLYVLHDARSVIAFFVTENLADGTCYWHLNAVASEVQGRGYGRRAWQAMLGHAQKEGAKRVRTSFVARNHRVLNLYARLGFDFSPPSMTFHWVR